MSKILNLVRAIDEVLEDLPVESGMAEKLRTAKKEVYANLREVNYRVEEDGGPKPIKWKNLT